jgi:hypothetical protein
VQGGSVSTLQATGADAVTHRFGEGQGSMTFQKEGRTAAQTLWPGPTCAGGGGAGVLHREHAVHHGDTQHHGGSAYHGGLLRNQGSIPSSDARILPVLSAALHGALAVDSSPSHAVVSRCVAGAIATCASAVRTGAAGGDVGAFAGERVVMTRGAGDVGNGSDAGGGPALGSVGAESDAKAGVAASDGGGGRVKNDPGAVAWPVAVRFQDRAGSCCGASNVDSSQQVQQALGGACDASHTVVGSGQQIKDSGDRLGGCAHAGRDISAGVELLIGQGIVHGASMHDGSGSKAFWDVTNATTRGGRGAESPPDVQKEGMGRLDTEMPSCKRAHQVIERAATHDCREEVAAVEHLSVGQDVTGSAPVTCLPDRDAQWLQGAGRQRREGKGGSGALEATSISDSGGSTARREEAEIARGRRVGKRREIGETRGATTSEKRHQPLAGGCCRAELSAYNPACPSAAADGPFQPLLPDVQKRRTGQLVVDLVSDDVAAPSAKRQVQGCHDFGDGTVPAAIASSIDAGQCRANAARRGVQGGPDSATSSVSHPLPAPASVAQKATDSFENATEAPFGLLWVRYNLPLPCNHGAFGVKLRQLVCGDMQLALISNYMINLTWLLSACPELSNAQKLIVVHGMDPSVMQEQVREGIPHLAQKVSLLCAHACVVEQAVFATTEAKIVMRAHALTSCMHPRS